VDAFGTCGNEPGEFFSIADLAVDSAGNLYVLKDDAVEQGSVEVFDSDGNYLSTWTVPFRVSESSMGFDLNDDLYISSSESDEIHKFSQSGVPLLSWLAPRPREIAVDSSNLVYVTDAEGDRVRIFTPTGQFVAAWLAGAGGENVKSIAISADDSIYLTDSFFHVQQPSPFAAKYTVNGDFLLAWDASGLGVIFDIAVYR
jgi:sugar lactone lactonase YvrE